DQAQTAGLSLYVPVNATLSSCGLPTWSSQAIDLYALRSAATSGFGICQDTTAKDFPTGLFQEMIAEVKRLRPLYNADILSADPDQREPGRVVRLAVRLTGTGATVCPVLPPATITPADHRSFLARTGPPSQVRGEV